MTKDGRSVRAQNIYDEAHEKLVDSAIELFNSPNVLNENMILLSKEDEESIKNDIININENS